MREQLLNDRTKVIEDIMKINPLFQPPADFVKSKPFRRLFIPLKEHPSYNFIGLIIGPRGNTQKRMERETGAKISIRGKGSIKEGSKGRANKNADEDEELHVHITGDSQEAVDAAAVMVQELLVPVDDEKNEHKQKQLRELALINGTLREDDFCQVCGEKGHRQFECPHRAKTFKAAGVKCAVCGDQSHPTRDCPFSMDAPTSAVTLDQEYNSFMAELGDGKGGGGGGDGTTTAKSEGGAGGGAVAAEAPPPKKQQVIITVTQVMTGATPILTSSMAPPMYAGQYGYPSYPYGTTPGMAYGAPTSMAYGAPPMPSMYGMPPLMMPYMPPPPIDPNAPWMMPPMPSPPMQPASVPGSEYQYAQQPYQQLPLQAQQPYASAYQPVSYLPPPPPGNDDTEMG